MRYQQRLDLAPFAENTIALAMDIEYNAADASQVPYLRKYQDDPVIIGYRQEWEKVRQLLKGVVAYSVELTTLGQSQLSGPERCANLADFLEPLADPVIVGGRHRLHITPAEMDTIIANIRQQPDLLAGLRQAQPLIDEVARLSDEILDEVGAAIDTTRAYLYRRIEAENADITLFEELIRKSRYRVFRETLLLSRYRAGERIDLQEVWQLDPQLLELVASPDTVTVAELEVLEDRLLFKMRAVAEFNQQMQPDVDRYHAMHSELALLYRTATKQLRKARVTMIVWARSHSDLARGITDPAKINLFDLTKKAAKMVI